MGVMKARRPLLVFTLLFIMCLTLRAFFSGWTKQDVSILVIAAATFLLILYEKIQNVIVWFRNKRRASLDERILAFLGKNSAGEKKTLGEISAAIGIVQKNAHASLHRLRDEYQADSDQLGRWYSIRRGVSN
jgi:hypothetical protein